MIAKKSEINKGSILYLVKFDVTDFPEIIVRVNNYDTSNNVIYADKVLMITKKVDAKGNISLTPLANSFIISSIDSSDLTDNSSSVQYSGMTFNLSRFDAYGIVVNKDVLDTFEKFSV